MNRIRCSYSLTFFEINIYLFFVFQPMAGNGNGPLFRPRSAKMANSPVIPEIEVYLHLLILIYLLDIKRYEKVSHSTMYHKSRVMRKPDFCKCVNKGAGQPSSNCEADQHLCFRYTDSTIPLLLIFKISFI